MRRLEAPVQKSRHGLYSRLARTGGGGGTSRAKALNYLSVMRRGRDESRHATDGRRVASCVSSGGVRTTQTDRQVSLVQGSAISLGGRRALGFRATKYMRNAKLSGCHQTHQYNIPALTGVYTIKYSFIQNEARGRHFFR